eukprot:TRINITY_DN11_c0_g1_i1.p1 TRINITY_DN11_c0_g1~~TRINITY_DN11_c0_g1_i1.p1  ORF type:complete len:1552 (+),score=399.19 TRINITY_DN11_c0_g1_i1:2293-6948(+)
MPAPPPPPPPLPTSLLASAHAPHTHSPQPTRAHSDHAHASPPPQHPELPHQLSLQPTRPLSEPRMHTDSAAAEHIAQPTVAPSHRSQPEARAPTDAVQPREQAPHSTAPFAAHDDACDDAQQHADADADADADAFIDWGDDDWNVDDDEHMTLEHAQRHMHDEYPNQLAAPLAQQRAADVDWFSLEPIKPQPQASSFPLPQAEALQTDQANHAAAAHANGAVDSPTAPEHALGESVPLEREPQLPQQPSAFEQQAPATFEDVGSQPTALLTDVAANDDGNFSDSFFVGQHEPEQRPPEQQHNLSMSQEHRLQSANEIEVLKAEIQRLTEERDKAMETNADEQQQNEQLKRSILTLKDKLERSEDLSETLTEERDSLLKNLTVVFRDKIDAEAERDAAIERGGDGIKEAHHLIEVMRGNEDAAREREAVIAAQIETMRSDIERVSSERNSLVQETEDLQRQLQLVKSQALLQEEQLRQQLQIASHEREIADLEREKALESIKAHAQEYETLYADERNRLAAIQEKDLRIQELERTISNREKEKEEEDTRIELLSKQIQDMKDHTHEIIEERNSFYQEKLGLENAIESFTARCEQAARDLHDAKRESASLKGERDEARTRYGSMREQNAELRKRIESLASERDRLIQERTAAAASSDSVSDKEKALAQECEQKTKSLALAQRKLTSLSSKIEKLTLQRGTYQRQRDEASARLRAAGEEFMTLHSKLESITNERDSMKTDLVHIREERDNANFRAQELASTAAEHVLVQEKLQAMSLEVEVVTEKLEESRKEVSELLDKEGSLKQKTISLSNELSQMRGRVEVLTKEKESAISQTEISEQEKAELRQRVLQLEEDLACVGKKAKSLEADISTSKETSAVEMGIVKAELLAEQKSRQEISRKLAVLQNDISLYKRTVADVYDKIRSSLQSSSTSWGQSSLSTGNALEWPEIPNESHEVDPTDTVRIVSVYTEFLSKLVDQFMAAHEDYEITKNQLDAYGTQLTKQAEEQHSLQQVEERCTLLQEELALARQNLLSATSDGDSMRQQLEELANALTTSKIRESELEEELRVGREGMQREIESLSQASTGEVQQARQELQNIITSLRTIWGMIQKSLDIEHMETFTDDGSEYTNTEEQGNLAVHVLRGTASLVAELSRSRSHLEESEQRCQNAENEVERLTERAEIAEQERDAFRGSNERLERKANNSRAEGYEEAKTHYEAVIAQLEDELEDLRHNLERMTEMAERSDKESGELRALCAKLTSQLNSRTNELDEAEEKNVYLQDQVTTLGEDLEEAHRRLQEHEEESAIAQREEVERLSSELRETSSELERTLALCSRLQSTCDEAETKAKECELLAETHRQAEENLRIAIEQLEAAQDSLVEQRTIELQQKLIEMDANLAEAKEQVSSVNVTENKLKIQDEEIKELRGAIGRLADERVELKLELEKSLSRLNHPDAGGQLVDRRVVRQLLVSYFRVGSVRRRDVLELMSRMLAFSESDNIAVGLKRRALIDRLGSLVQAPELDDASLPPIGTVSDKWIEFLMKETEEGEEQAKGW